ncbi:amidohydrolase family protein [Fodinicola feengrottensis]|uniref:Amidohydrolase family protein n=1 Tax=Fodinicola feengrottensis TaxID=435914 RepID=A0ABN2HZX1_9ACTN
MDAHAHLTLTLRDGTMVLADRAFRDATLAAARTAGTLLIRDVGGDPALTLELARDPSSGVLAAGRFLSSQDYYFPGAHTPVHADDLAAAAVEQIQLGAQWVKLVGDFPYKLQRGVPSTPTYPLESVRAMVDAVHAAGGRVAAHTQSTHLANLVPLGIDSVEHGDEMDEASLHTMAATGAGWTPTLCMTMAPPRATDSEYFLRRRAARIERMKTMIPLAHRLGVPIMTGTDVVGFLPQEVSNLVHCGLSPVDALRSATTTARTFLGRPGFVDAEPADVVTYEDDPREDPSVLGKPAAVVRRGVRIA